MSTTVIRNATMLVTMDAQRREIPDGRAGDPRQRHPLGGDDRGSARRPFGQGPSG